MQTAIEVRSFPRMPSNTLAKLDQVISMLDRESPMTRERYRHKSQSRGNFVRIPYTRTLFPGVYLQQCGV